jgi:hypothetical protein
VENLFVYWTFFDDDDDVFNVLARCLNICVYIVGKSKNENKYFKSMKFTYMYKQEEQR